MLPIGPLMIEHRLIEKMIVLIQREIDQGKQQKRINPAFIDLTVDFIHTYADRCHHGKEENILFRDLNKKDLSSELKQIMGELVEEHRLGRKIVSDLIEAKERYLKGDQKALSFILNRMQLLVDFYPKHIAKEDRHFFMPVMAYFSQTEKEAMLQEEYEFDKNLVHQIYKEAIGQAEKMLEG